LLLEIFELTNIFVPLLSHAIFKTLEKSSFIVPGTALNTPTIPPDQDPLYSFSDIPSLADAIYASLPHILKSASRLPEFAPGTVVSVGLFQFIPPSAVPIFSISPFLTKYNVMFDPDLSTYAMFAATPKLGVVGTFQPLASAWLTLPTRSTESDSSTQACASAPPTVNPPANSKAFRMDGFPIWEGFGCDFGALVRRDASMFSGLLFSRPLDIG
jgi:hypothetical protein